MKRVILIPTALLLNSLLTTTAHATNNDYVVLESIRAVNSTVTLEDDLVYELTVSAPSTFSWSPTDSNFDGFLKLLLCRTGMIVDASNPTECDYMNLQSRYLLTKIQNASIEANGSRTNYAFELYGKPINYIVGEYFVYIVRIPKARESDPEETNLYYFERTTANDIFGTSFSPVVPTFTNTYAEVLAELPTPEPEPTIEPTPDPAPAPDPVPTPTQQPVVNNPAPRVIQSNFYLPAIAGDINWKPMKQIKGKFDGWKRLKKNAINGGRNQVTKTNGAMITFRSKGDALSLRFLGGNERGSFSIYVNGELLDQVDAKRKMKRALIKTWEGLGKGSHFIDVVAELTPGESIAINGVHSPRS